VACVRKKIHFEDEIREIIPNAEIYAPLQVRRELERLSENRGLKLLDREAAKTALALAWKLSDLDLGKEYVDEGLVEYCGKNSGCYVATIDRNLKKTLKGVAKIIYLKAGKKIVAD
jgi:rRNA-processing protein FCF1